MPFAFALFACAPGCGRLISGMGIIKLFVQIIKLDFTHYIDYLALVTNLAGTLSYPASGYDFPAAKKENRRVLSTPAVNRIFT